MAIRCIAGVWLLCTGAALAQEIDYRVSGTIVGVGGTSMAVIERRPEGSVIVAPGDDIDGGRVVEIAQRHVRLSFGDRDLLVPLNGAPAQAVAPRVLASAQPDDLYTRRVSSTEFLHAIGQISGEVGAGAATRARADAAGGAALGPGAGVGLAARVGAGDEARAPNDGDELADDVRELARELPEQEDGRDPGRVLAELLDGIVDVPPGATIQNINGETFTTVQQGLGLIEGYVAQNAIVRFEMQTNTEPSQPLYLFPE